MPKGPFQLDQLLDDGVIPLNAVYLQLLPADQHRHVRCLLAGDGQLMLHLALDVLWYAIGPEPGAIEAGGFALQDLHLWISHYRVIQIGQHPGLVCIRVLEHGIHSPYLVARRLGIGLGHLGFKKIAPVQRGMDVVRVGGR